MPKSRAQVHAELLNDYTSSWVAIRHPYKGDVGAYMDWKTEWYWKISKEFPDRDAARVRE